MLDAAPDVARVPSALEGAGRARARHGAFGQLWLDAMWRGDPLADAVVRDGARDVRAALARGIDAIERPSDALLALFAELEDEPAWVDRDRSDRGAAHLARQHREYGLVLGAASLVLGAQNAVAGKPLVFTGRYVRDAAVRSLEVGSWLVAVTTPGALAPARTGFERAVRVRMIHAHVRAQLSREERWRTQEWGVPIPQPYMAFTLAEFCSVALRAMAQLGVRYRDDEREDIVHLWRRIGRLTGVDADLLPASAEDYARIEELYALTSPGADREDREFVAALADFQARELGRLTSVRAARPIVAGLQRAFAGDAVADDLAIADRWHKHLPALVRPLLASAYASHDALVPHGRERRTRRALRVRGRELKRMRARYGVGHDLVDAAPRTVS